DRDDSGALLAPDLEDLAPDPLVGDRVAGPAALALELHGRSRRWAAPGRLVGLPGPERDICSRAIRRSLPGVARSTITATHGPRPGGRRRPRPGPAPPAASHPRRRGGPRHRDDGLGDTENPGSPQGWTAYVAGAGRAPGP